jgi:hypothetical protein
MRAIVALLDGEPVGIIGVTQGQPVGRLFSEYKPALEPFLKGVTVLRAVKRVQAMLDGVVYAVARGVEGERVLCRLGFERRGDLYWRV